MNIFNNLMLLTDSYKASHYKQYPKGTKRVYSYFESRGGFAPETVFFGLQYLLLQYLSQPIKTYHVEHADRFYSAHLGPGVFNKEGWSYIANELGGKLPVEIKAVPEGTVVPTKNVLMTIENTDDNCYWLTNYLETLLVQTWYPTTVATLSREMKKLILKYLNLTGDPSLIDFKLHDFGFRGVSSVESAGLGGAAHLLNFKGTDTVAGILLADQVYASGVCGFSIPAAEHSTITSWGKENESNAYANMLEQYPTGLVAVVSDSYDIYNACRSIWGDTLRDKVLSRDGVLVIRPDSGYPPDVVVRCLDILGERFGFTTNNKNFRVLNPKVRLIQGDGIDYDMTRNILHAMYERKWSTDNVTFGMGGALLQKLNRDTQKFAFKASSVVVGDEERAVFKKPITDSGKKSKAGRLALVKRNGELVTVSEREAVESNQDNLLQTVFLNGKVVNAYQWKSVVERAKV